MPPQFTWITTTTAQFCCFNAKVNASAADAVLPLIKINGGLAVLREPPRYRFHDLVGPPEEKEEGGSPGRNTSPSATKKSRTTHSRCLICPCRYLPLPPTTVLWVLHHHSRCRFLPTTVGRIKKEPCVNHGLSRNCNSVFPYKWFVRKETAFVHQAIVRFGWEGGQKSEKPGDLPSTHWHVASAIWSRVRLE